MKLVSNWLHVQLEMCTDMSTGLRTGQALLSAQNTLRTHTFSDSSDGHGTCEAYFYQLCDVHEFLCHQCNEDHLDSLLVV